MIVLETDRLLFRDHCEEDLEAYIAMESDPDVRRFVGGKPRTREAAEAKFRSVYLPEIPNYLGLWATVYKPESRYIGYCGVYPHFNQWGEAIPNEGTLAYYLAKDYWGKGLATEAGGAFLEFGFTTLMLSKVVATAEVGNIASLRVLEKLGFTKLRLDEGSPRPLSHFELTSHDFLQRHDS